MLSGFVVDNMWLFVLGLTALWFAYRCYKESKRVPDKDQKYVYITGCDTGFGNLLAKHLDQLGYRVIAGCYTEKGEDELKKRTSDRLTTVQLDVSDSANVAKAAAFIGTLVGDKGELAFISLLRVCDAIKFGIDSISSKWRVRIANTDVFLAKSAYVSSQQCYDLICLIFFMVSCL